MKKLQFVQAFERPNIFRPGALSISHKSAQTSQSPLPVPCKRSSAAPIPFGFQLSVALSRRFALPVTARSAPCGFVPLRQSRRNTVLRTPSYMGGIADVFYIELYKEISPILDFAPVFS